MFSYKQGFLFFIKKKLVVFFPKKLNKRTNKISQIYTWEKHIFPKKKLPIYWSKNNINVPKIIFFFSSKFPFQVIIISDFKIKKLSSSNLPLLWAKK